MSGVTGNQKIEGRINFKKILKEYTEIISQFPGFVSVSTSGSYNSNKRKSTFGDMDLILTVKDYTDVKVVKTKLAKFLTKLSEDTIVPFESEKYKGKRYYNSGEIITVSYQTTNKDITPCQIDNIIALSDEEAKFKKSFLDLPAEKQGLILGLVKTILVENSLSETFDKMGIIANIDVSSEQEYEFNLSSKELQLRLVTYTEPGSFRQLGNEVVWRTQDWSVVLELLENYDLSLPFNKLIIDIKSKFKYPRSSRRMLGIFKSMISVKSGEQGKPKGNKKQKAIKKVEKVFGETFKEVITEMASKRNIVYTFGRFNPPTKGHEALWEFVSEQGKRIKGDGRVYPSLTVDNIKNPLKLTDKIKYLNQSVSDLKNVRVCSEQDLKDPFDVLERLMLEGYTKIQFVVGADRAKQFTSLSSYATEWSDGNVTADVIVFSEDRIGDFSATKMREYVIDDKFYKFFEDAPNHLRVDSITEMFNKVKEGLEA